MQKLLLSAALAALTVVGLATEAAAWTRESTTTTWRGTYESQSSGSCANGTCSSTGSTTGPLGNTVNRSGSITRTAPGQFDYSRTTTGPKGGQINRNGTITIQRND